MHRAAPISIPVAGVRGTRYRCDGLYRGIKDAYAIARVDSGFSEWWADGKVWTSVPGSFQLKAPAQVHRDLRRDGPATFQVVIFDLDLVTAAAFGARLGRLDRLQLDRDDAHAVAFARLHAAVDRSAEPLALEVAVVEAAGALATLLTRRPAETMAGAWRRPVRRAVDFLHEHLAEPVRLDAIAAHAQLDRFHLSRAFRDQVGLPPHAYLTQLRVLRAKQLLAMGIPPSSVAPLVGFYDQSQLHRHFRRIVGMTPGAFRAERSSPARSCGRPPAAPA